MYSSIRAALASWKHDVRGVTAIEYSLIAGAISLTLVAAIFLMGDSLIALFDQLVEWMTGAEEEISE